MNRTFIKCVNALRISASRFDESGMQQRIINLKKLTTIKLSESKELVDYYDVLLFICGYPSDMETLLLAERELARMTGFLKKIKPSRKGIFNNTGLPYTKSVSRFSYDLMQWLITKSDCKLEIDGFRDELFDLNDVLKHTLPSLERSETTAGLKNFDLLDSLLVKKSNRLSFLLSELDKFSQKPFQKDHFFEGLGLYVGIYPKNKMFSRVSNRLPVSHVFYHDELLKNFDFLSLLNHPIPEVDLLTVNARCRIIETVKNAMALTDRETDPTTFLESHSLRFYELERGISVAIYGMIPERQLPLESYVGYTLFKNGFPAAYGGAWIFGARANFGINIFDSFRGGESGYMMCQLLRVYRQVFRICYFEVEPYQFGLDNPEGISSGAFWFYYRYGFRPLDKSLLKISVREWEKIKSRKGYRTNRKILVGFTESNIALNLGGKVPLKVPDVSLKVTRMIAKTYRGNRLTAELDCIDKFKTKTGYNEELNVAEKQVLQELALWAQAYLISDHEKLNLMVQMVKVKPVNLYDYQKLLVSFLEME